MHGSSYQAIASSCLTKPSLNEASNIHLKENEYYRTVLYEGSDREGNSTTQTVIEKISPSHNPQTNDYIYRIEKAKTS